MPDKRKNRIDKKDSSKIAEHNYDSSYYQGKDQFEKGLAETHEQVSDDYKEGTIDQKSD
ncbi:YozQ family protein [Virgibacillus siamensis]|uniref:YozQ family protein n=1 Tax=Virgibacillus siamensis TaxID=480071 RepID=UPI0009870E7F|nr:YozQ family protein [Virgibacillus siamensis]